MRALSLVILCTGCTIETGLSPFEPGASGPSQDAVPSGSLDFEPWDLDLDAPPAGCTVAQAVTVRNVGDAALTVSALRGGSHSNEIVWERPADLPWVLAPGESRPVGLTYTPLDDTPDESWLVALSDDPASPRATAWQRAPISRTTLVVDAFDQPWGAMPADILFVVDDSPSMVHEQQRLADNGARLFARLALSGADYQVGVITTSSPTLQGAWITPETGPVALREFGRQVHVGTAGARDEQGLKMAEQALAAASDTLRDGTLSVVFISDEPDHSQRSAAWTLDALQSLASSPERFVAHAIVGPVPDGCSGAEPGEGYTDLAQATGGQIISICDDWGDALGAIGERAAAPRAAFALSEPAVPETVTVTVDGAPQAEGWRYDEGSGEVIFDATAAPEGGAEVEISYAVQEDCGR